MTQPLKSIAVLSVYPSTSKRFRKLMMPIVGAAGGTVMVAIQFGNGFSFSSLEDYVMVPAAVLGAALAGFVTAGLFGHNGDVTDWVVSVIGAALATSLGSAIGGFLFGVTMASIDFVSGADHATASFLLTVPFGTGAVSTVIVWALIFDVVSVAVIWGCAMLAVHLAAVVLRRKGI